MTLKTKKVRATVKRTHHLTPGHDYNGAELYKEFCLPEGCSLFLDQDCGPDLLIEAEKYYHFDNDECFYVKCEKGFSIKIDGRSYRIQDPVQTGSELKQLAGIPDSDVLFLDLRGEEDQIIAPDEEVKLYSGACLFSQPPSDYGNSDIAGLPEGALQHPQPNGWNFVIIPNVLLPENYSPRRIDILVKLPPAFPDASPDMFWCSPAVKTSKGQNPKATSSENILGKNWQRFSWHIKPGGWRPGISNFQTFMSCIRGRFGKGD